MDAGDNLANLRVESFSYYLRPSEENFAQKISSRIEDPLPAILSQETSFPITPRRTISPVIKPSHNFNFSPPINMSQDKLSNHRVAASFSPHHLSDAQENFVFTVKGPVQDLSAALLLPRISPTHVERVNSTNGEIGVFGADKYFNTRLDYAARMKHENRNEEPQPVDVSVTKSNLRPAAPSVSSDASSWNSQAALLRNLSQNVSRTRPRRAIGRKIFCSLGCTGPCLDREAESAAENKRIDNGTAYGEKGSQPGSKGVDNNQFAFPILNSDEAKNATVKKQLDHGEKLEDYPRKSLEVFGSDRMKKGDIAANLARKLSMLTWDAIPKASNLPTTTVGSTTICDDMTSDASSDLFEIEDITSTGYPILTMEAAHDNMSAGCMSPPTQYAPSEASIEWSVVTASAADFSSVISDYDEKNICISGDIIPANTVNRNYRSKCPVGKEEQKIRPGGLLGCKSQKALNVAETVHKTRVERVPKSVVGCILHSAECQKLIS